tara:strand:+ start:881 stop:1129 length:249 start_codon:yes stop_codon:yes gene_type:complete
LNKECEEDNFQIGDLVQKTHSPGQGRFAVITKFSTEDDHIHIPMKLWVRIVYADTTGGYEWVHPEGLKRLTKPLLGENKEKK